MSFVGALPRPHNSRMTACSSGALSLSSFCTEIHFFATLASSIIQHRSQNEPQPAPVPASLPDRHRYSKCRDTLSSVSGPVAHDPSCSFSYSYSSSPGVSRLASGGLKHATSGSRPTFAFLPHSFIFACWLSVLPDWRFR